MQKDRFYFKQFSVSHTRSSMKVGVDGVLIGIWTKPAASRRILDVGTGCGIISLIMAQRYPLAIIQAIDIDRESILESRENFQASPWKSRMQANYCDFSHPDILEYQQYDLIISNPPYFDSGVTDVSDPRMAARHQMSLPLQAILHNSSRLLTDEGMLSMIIPAEFEQLVVDEGLKVGMKVARICRVRGRKESAIKRIMIELCKSESKMPAIYEELVLEENRGFPTEEYRNLGKEFYLKF